MGIGHDESMSSSVAGKGSKHAQEGARGCSWWTGSGTLSEGKKSPSDLKPGRRLGAWWEGPTSYIIFTYRPILCACR